MAHVDRTAVPVFPLPELVLFPGVAVPLHVFELRYRAMVRDVLSGDRTIALALLAPGYELDYHGSPEFHPLGCLGRIEEVEWLPDDRYDLKVVGETRVRFGRVEREFPYRSVRVELLPQHPYAEDDPLVQMDKATLIDLHGKLLRLAEEHGGEAAQRALPAVVETDSYERIVNKLSTVCGRSGEERLALLAEDSVLERGRRVREALERALSSPGGPESGDSDGQRN